MIEASPNTKWRKHHQEAAITCVLACAPTDSAEEDDRFRRVLVTPFLRTVLKGRLGPQMGTRCPPTLFPCTPPCHPSRREG
jgi:hypothetical protein